MMARELVGRTSSVKKMTLGFGCYRFSCRLRSIAHGGAYLGQRSVAVVAESHEYSEMDRYVFLTKVTFAFRGRGLHGESGFNWL